MENIRRLLKKANVTPIYSLVLALVIGGIIILASGNSPFEIYGMLLEGAFGSRKGILQTLLQSTPLLFCGLAVSFGLKGGILNLGVEGQVYIGALCSTLVAIFLNGIPAPLHISLCIIAGMVGGMIWSAFPILLKIKKGAHEVVTALMLNYVAIYLLDFLLNYPLKDPNSSVAQSVVIRETAQLVRIFDKSKVTIAIIIGVALALLLNVILKKTVFGYKVTMVGSNPLAAAASGIDVNKTMVATMLISGLCAGLAGSMEVLGTYYRLIQGFSSGYGFEGIAVAVLGASPISVIFSSLIFGSLRAGGLMLNFGTNLSVKFITVLQGIIIVVISAPLLVPNLKTELEKRLNMGRKG